VLSLAQPTSTEWQFASGAEVAYSAANIYAKVYTYDTIVTVVDDSTLIGSFEKDNYITAVSGGVTGRIVAWDPETRKLEVAIDSSSADVLEIGDTISELANSSNTPG
jgi:hypothetical protein